ncbi:type III polyketide synthase [Ferruginibacter sp. HRS2-29]|uniref:type III polyketide synthase n=1 Tax=Ferruginibacter sp. HRS2-29 TaxID=2487334 RepID=UPI0020CCDC95|nr:type III polyketide synthase [Ferruginibacter sp. HRS2-29]MCP9749764.1 type III polyketide synthase [Ferruginibacter sp. HRS2-29]
MSKITSIATSLPEFKHTQDDLYKFSDNIYSSNETDSRKLKFIYHQSGISTRYSVIPDYSSPREQWTFFPPSKDLEPFPAIEQRMKFYSKEAAKLSISAIEKCIGTKISKTDITHLITVSCTGMSAPGLDLDIIEQMGLPKNIVRSSVNFMGCYAAIHAMKIADAFCKSSSAANVIVVCTELCTLHFQKDISVDNITASLLFSDGCAAMLFQNDVAEKGITLRNFFSDVSFKGRQDMAWEISSKGFLMTLSGFVPDLIKEDFEELVTTSLKNAGKTKADITHWCIHPGGKKILDTIVRSLAIDNKALQHSYTVLNDYGNMSSATIVFVLQKILEELSAEPLQEATIFGAAFGPGLTMETFTATYG